MVLSTHRTSILYDGIKPSNLQGKIRTYGIWFEEFWYYSGYLHSNEPFSNCDGSKDFDAVKEVFTQRTNNFTSKDWYVEKKVQKHSQSTWCYQEMKMSQKRKGVHSVMFQTDLAKWTNAFIPGAKEVHQKLWQLYRQDTECFPYYRSFCDSVLLGDREKDHITF